MSYHKADHPLKATDDWEIPCDCSGCCVCLVEKLKKIQEIAEKGTGDSFQGQLLEEIKEICES